jgi:hypothetical protein
MLKGPEEALLERQEQKDNVLAATGVRRLQKNHQIQQKLTT